MTSLPRFRCLDVSLVILISRGVRSHDDRIPGQSALFQADVEAVPVPLDWNNYLVRRKRSKFRKPLLYPIFTMAAPPPPQTFPYDYLFKVLVIGDASVGKVGANNVPRLALTYLHRRRLCTQRREILKSGISPRPESTYFTSFLCHLGWRAEDIKVWNAISASVD